MNDERNTMPHLVNLNPDPQLSGKLVHIFYPGTKEIGNRKGKESDIVIIGPRYSANIHSIMC